MPPQTLAMDMKLMALIARCLVLLCTVVPVTAMAWNPYDTDSARARGYGEDYGSPGYYGTPAQPPRREQEATRPLPTESGRRGDEWGQSDWYAEDPRRTGGAWGPDLDQDAGYPSRPLDGYGYDGYGIDQQRRSPAQPERRRPQDVYGYDGYGIEPQQQRPSPPGDGWDTYGMERDGGADWLEPQPPVWEQRTRPQYRFRGDPELDALTGRGRAPEGYRYRPLTERELERRRTDQQYPELHDRDLLPRGPWRSYEDEGTAFGYHPEGSAYERYYRGSW